MLLIDAQQTTMGSLKMKDIFQPKYINRLKAKIHEKGFKTLSEYCTEADVDISRVSRIITGWEIPSASLAEKMSKPLDFSIDDFSQLL